MKVIDLFCGCGGITQGFKMAGFSVIYGLDNNRDAIRTFARNFPDAEACVKKIEDLDETELPDADIIVGGPPCVNFSSSKGSRANVLEGLKLVQAFLRVVYIKKPKYWLMENVPRIGLHLPEQIPLKWIGIDKEGYLDVPNRKLFKIAEYGAPQGRERLLIGNYPIPKGEYINTKSKFRTLGDVISSFPKPKSKPSTSSEIVDPIYNFDIKENELTDHFYDTTLTDQETKMIRNAKENHPYMGYMCFPDNLDKPARTVVALQMGRETIVVNGDKNKYRRLTVRECASLQTFPVSFQFSGSTVSSRYKQVGNAVPPILTYNIAKEILIKEQLPLQENPRIDFPDPFEKPSSIILSKKRKIDYSKPRKINFPAKELRGFRIEFISAMGNPSVKWNVILHSGEGKANHTTLSLTDKNFPSIIDSCISQSGKETFGKYQSCIEECRTLSPVNPQYLHNYLHDNYGEIPEEFSLYTDIIDKYFPSNQYKTLDVPLNTDFPFDRRKLRIRLLVGIRVADILLKGLNCRIKTQCCSV